MAALRRRTRPAKTVERYDPHWARTPGGRYHRLAHLDVEDCNLVGQSGIFVCWHAGVQPTWVYVGRADDLAAAIAAIAEDERIVSYEAHGGLFITWACVRGEYCEGMVLYLTRALNPLVRDFVDPDDEDAFPIPVRSPGA